MPLPQKILRDLTLLPKERILEAIPCRSEGWTTKYHAETENHPIFGFINHFVKKMVPEINEGKFAGYFLLTQWRMLFVVSDPRYASYSEIMHDIPLHHVDEISSNPQNQSLHIDAHTSEGVSHFTFFGKEIAAQKNTLTEAVRVHDAADYWRAQKRGSFVRCKKCGKPITKGLKFCPYCGTRQAR